MARPQRRSCTLALNGLLPLEELLHVCSSSIHRPPIPGRPEGYPVVLTVNLPEQRSRDMMKYLLDGAYLDAASTKSLEGVRLARPSLPPARPSPLRPLTH